jgi:hypothetical protein
MVDTPEQIDNTTPGAGGQPTKYKPEFTEQAYRLSLLGVTDIEMAQYFDVCEATINNWKHYFPEFLESITRGKLNADSKVAFGLYERATGAEWEEQQAFKIKVDSHLEKVEIVTVKRKAPPDTQAASLWLRNRRSGQWSETSTVNQNHNVLSETIALIDGQTAGLPKKRD